MRKSKISARTKKSQTTEIQKHDTNNSQKISDDD